MKKLNRTGIIFAVLHTLVFTYIISIVLRSASAGSDVSGQILPSFSIIADQLPFMVCALLIAIPGLNIIAENTVFIFGAYYIFGGFQWYLIGWVLGTLLRKDSWKK